MYNVKTHVEPGLIRVTSRMDSHTETLPHLNYRLGESDKGFKGKMGYYHRGFAAILEDMLTSEAVIHISLRKANGVKFSKKSVEMEQASLTILRNIGQTVEVNVPQHGDDDHVVQITLRDEETGDTINYAFKANDVDQIVSSDLVSYHLLESNDFLWMKSYVKRRDPEHERYHHWDMELVYHVVHQADLNDLARSDKEFGMEVSKHFSNTNHSYGFNMHVVRTPHALLKRLTVDDVTYYTSNRSKCMRLYNLVKGGAALVQVRTSDRDWDWKPVDEVINFLKGE